MMRSLAFGMTKPGFLFSAGETFGLLVRLICEGIHWSERNWKEEAKYKAIHYGGTEGTKGSFLFYPVGRL